jgi:hypothetical protein
VEPPVVTAKCPNADPGGDEVGYTGPPLLSYASVSNVALLILLPKLRGSDYYPGGTDSHRTRQPSLDAQRLLLGGSSGSSTVH